MKKRTKPVQPGSLTFRTPADRGEFEIIRRIEILTPVFGGGVHIDKDAPHRKKTDEITPLRGSSIRGQLRFWWRATHGCQCRSVPEMRKREVEIWGGPGDEMKGTKDSVRLRLSVVDLRCTDVPVYRDDKPRNAHEGMRDVAYGAFPLQPATTAPNQRPGGLSRLEFKLATLTLAGPAEHGTEVEDAVDAWLTFGGVGGRTRRGFGATASPDSDLQRVFEKWSPKKAETLPLVPTLIGSTLTKRAPAADAMAAWKIALGKLQEFRQGRGVGRNPREQQPTPGRSYWPEPDQIRRITGRHSRDPHNHKPEHPVKKFPRAAFGMPIIFHFKDERQGDPRDATLQPSASNRMASPLIVRPSRDKRPIALLLNVPGADVVDVQLDGKGVQRSLTPSEAAQIVPLRGNPHVLDAFLTFFAE